MPVKEEPPSPVLLPPPKEPKVLDCKFFFILLGDLSRLKLPSGFAEAKGEDRPDQFWVRESIPSQEFWTCGIALDEAGRMFVTRGWSGFVHAYDLQQGFFLQFRHRRGNPRLLVKIFDGSTCRRYYSPVVGGGSRWR